MNRFQIALQFLEKVFPEVNDETQRKEYSDNKNPTDPPSSQIDYLKLNNYINSIEPLAYYSVLLGICDDGLPLLIDLCNHNLGSVLISGRQFTANQLLLRIMLKATILLNPPQYVQLSVITHHVNTFESDLTASHCHGILRPNIREASELVMELCALVEQRNSGRQRGPAIILAIDELNTLICEVDENIRSHFSWLLREGPFAKVWPIACISEDLYLLPEYHLDIPFRTKIQAIDYLPLYNDHSIPDRNNTYRVNRFQVNMGRENIKFSLPLNG